MRVAAIIVTYNRKALLYRCVEHLLRQAGVAPDVWIIDNASTDGTREALSAYNGDERVHYHNTGKNLGGAGGFHAGMKLVMQQDYDALWIMDDDTLPDEGALAALLRADERLAGEYGYLSSKVLWTDDTVCNMNRPKRTAFADATDFESPLAPIAMASFVSLFLRTETVRTFGLPIAEFFIWTDDWEYTRRISRARACFLVNESTVVHAMKQNGIVSIASDTADRLPRYRCFYRNDVVLYRREGLRGCLYLLAKDAWHAAQVLLHGQAAKGEKLRTIWQGFWTGMRFHPAIEYPDAHRALYVLSTLCRGGGVESFCMMAQEQLVHLGWHIDFLILGIYEPELVRELRQKGLSVTLLGERRKDDFAWMLRSRGRIKAYFRTHSYPLVHFHTCSQSVVIPLFYAGDFKRRIVHSHVAGEPSPFGLKRLRYALVRCFLSRRATDALACSRAAGLHMFTAKLCVGERFHVVPNGLNLALFRYAPDTRKEMRSRLGLGNALVLGSVGRLTESKNQAFTLEVFAAVRAKRPDARLLLVGDGELKDELMARANALNVADAVHLAGRVDDVQNWLQAMDVFVFTPRFEGLGIVLIEAQATGLPCVVSDTVQREACVLPTVHRLSLQSPAASWAEAVLEAATAERTSQTAAIAAAGYSDADVGAMLDKIYH